MPPQRYGEIAANLVQEKLEPRKFKEAIESSMNKEWRNAMDEEISSLMENKTWNLVKLPGGKKPIGCKWIYKTKCDEHGNVVRYKARLVAQGFSQKFGVDYDEVFAPVVRQITFRTVLAVASCRKMIVKHVDIKTAYFYGELQETIYMRQPPGYEKEEVEVVCCLNKKFVWFKARSASLEPENQSNFAEMWIRNIRN